MKMFAFTTMSIILRNDVGAALRSTQLSRVFISPAGTEQTADLLITNILTIPSADKPDMVSGVANFACLSRMRGAREYEHSQRGSLGSTGLHICCTSVAGSQRILSPFFRPPSEAQRPVLWGPPNPSVHPPSPQPRQKSVPRYVGDYRQGEEDRPPEGSQHPPTHHPATHGLRASCCAVEWSARVS